VSKFLVSDIKPSPTTLQAVAQKLLNTSEKSPDYWPTVLQFLNFASASISSSLPSTLVGVNASNTRLNDDTFTGFRITLDGGEVKDSKFINSRIVFTTNPVRLENVTFMNCVFEMPVTDNPSPYLQKASQALLGSGLNSGSFSSLS
jgi:hypothetical protein